MNCEYCKCQIFDHDRFCPRCGAPIKYQELNPWTGKLSVDGNGVSGCVLASDLDKFQDYWNHYYRSAYA